MVYIQMQFERGLSLVFSLWLKIQWQIVFRCESLSDIDPTKVF